MNSLGSMPLGNGDIGLNVWVEKSGDLLFYIGKTDAWSENGRLLKLGRVRVSLSPNSYAPGGAFRQVLKLKEGLIEICTGEGSGKVVRRIWVDANHPVIDVEIESRIPVQATVSLEAWRRVRRHIVREDEAGSAYGLHGNGGELIVVEPDSILPRQPGRIVWFHRNVRSLWRQNLVLQGLEGQLRALRDPLLHRTFGGLIEGEGFASTSDTSLQTPNRRGSMHLTMTVLTSRPDSAAQWVSATFGLARRINALPLEVRFQAHREWWSKYWKRSSIVVTSTDTTLRQETEAVTRGYALQRFVNACGGRGNSPIKFNGSLFTVDTYDRTDDSKGMDADYRRWGGAYWFQNTRLPYWSMLCSGDFEMMAPLFRMYMEALPLRRAATQKYYGHEGAFYPETMYSWGTYVDANYGRRREGIPDGLTENTYIRYYWTSGLELALMMLDHFDFTSSTPFAADTCIPFATEILKFFDRHWNRDGKGRIRFDPAQALETYQRAVNPLPDVAGARVVAERLLALPETLTSADLRRQCARMLTELPDIPFRTAEGNRLLAPAEEYDTASNIENPELYAVFPFRLYGFGKPGLDIALKTFAARTQKLNGGWQQSSIQAAYLGLADEAARLVVDNFATWDPQCRFPAFWGPNFDWTPDQDHGSVAMIALQRMLIQYEGKKIIVLPAWPEDWDASFTLHAPYNTVVTGSVRKGRIEELQVTPESRRKDLIVR